MQLIQTLSSTRSIIQLDVPTIETYIETLYKVASGIPIEDTIIIGDSEFQTLSSSESWNDYIINVDYNSTLTNLITTVCSLSGNVATRILDGVGQFRISNGIANKGISLSFLSDRNEISNTFYGFVENSDSDIITKTLTRYLTAGGDLNYYTNFDATTSIIKNENCWLSDIDLSGISIGADTRGQNTFLKVSTGTLISRRHVIGAKHWNVYYPSYAPASGWVIGTKLRFRGSNGNFYVYTVTGISYYSDIILATLNEDVHESISHMSIVGDWYVKNRTYITSSTTSFYIGGLVFHVDQTFKCYMAMVGSIYNYVGNTYTSTISGISYTNDQIATCISPQVIYNLPQFPSFLEGIMNYYRSSSVGGDSGNPVMVLIDDTPALLWTWWYSYGGPPLWKSEIINALIRDSDASAGVSTNYTATIIPAPSS